MRNGGRHSCRARSGNPMYTQGKRLGLLLSLMLALVMVSPVAHAAATQISGDADLDEVACPGPPDDYGDFKSYPGIVLTGSLDGCLYTKVVNSRETPSGVYVESGNEVFVGTMNGLSGTFVTAYRFESKWDVNGAEVHGRCQHPLLRGTGTGVFEGATGRLDFKDIIDDQGSVTYVYRGHLSLR